MHFQLNAPCFYEYFSLLFILLPQCFSLVCLYFNNLEKNRLNLVQAKRRGCQCVLSFLHCVLLENHYTIIIHNTVHGALQNGWLGRLTVLPWRWA